MSFQFVTESQGVGSGFFFGLNLTFSILVFTHKGGGGVRNPRNRYLKFPLVSLSYLTENTYYLFVPAIYVKKQCIFYRF